MSSSTTPQTTARPRTLLIIGGAEDKIGRSVILKRFVRLAGGRQSRIVLVPTASSFVDEVVEAYTSVFTRLRAGSDLEVVHAASRAAAHDPQLVERLDHATGVFITGGSQLKLSQYLVGTPVGDAIHAAYQRGAVIAGTSAGASVMSRFMISLGEEGLTPRQRSSQLTAGLGLLENVIVDQHFDQRGRYGRLLSLVANSPNLLGMGIDENTATEIRDEHVLTIIGAGSVFNPRRPVGGHRRPGCPTRRAVARVRRRRALPADRRDLRPAGGPSDGLRRTPSRPRGRRRVRPRSRA